MFNFLTKTRQQKITEQPKNIATLVSEQLSKHIEQHLNEMLAQKIQVFSVQNLEALKFFIPSTFSIVVDFSYLTEQEATELVTTCNVKNVKILGLNVPKQLLSSPVLEECTEENVVEKIVVEAKYSEQVAKKGNSPVIYRKIIGLHNTKGGIGTTTSSIILATVAAHMGLNVLLVDASTISNDIETYLLHAFNIELEENILRTNLILPSPHMDEEVYKTQLERSFAIELYKIMPNLSFIPGPRSLLSMHDVSEEQVLMLYRNLPEFDLAIFDIGNQLSSPFLKAMKKVDNAYIVYVFTNTLTSINNIIAEHTNTPPKQFMLLPVEKKESEITIDYAKELISKTVNKALENKEFHVSSTHFLSPIPYTRDFNLETTRYKKISQFVDKAIRYGLDKNIEIIAKWR